MRGAALLVLLASAAGAAAGSASSRAPADCVPDGGAGTRCLYRSFLPSAGIVASCRHDHDCRVGYYSGNPADPAWFTPPPGMTTLPKPEVTWPAAMLAQVRFDCGRPCSVSYFFDVKRRRLSAPRWHVLAVDVRRSLLAAAEERALVVRQIFSGREVARIVRDWAPGAWLGDAITALRFEPDGRLSLTWLRGPDRVAVAERPTIPSFARP
jgi:hypothetical protein